MIRTIAMLAFWSLALPLAALICFPWTFLTGDIRFLYRVAMGAAVDWERGWPEYGCKPSDSTGSIPNALTCSCRTTYPTSIRPSCCR